MTKRKKTPARRKESKKWKRHKKQKTSEAIAAWYRVKEIDAQMDFAIDKDD